jgi:hypothetical protein
MTKSAIFIVVVLFSLYLSSIISGCAGTNIKRLTGAEFLNQAKQIELPNSFYWTTYIGISKQRAYLEYGYPAFIGEGMRTTILWTPLAELPKQIVNQLKTGTSPWKSW